MDSIVSIIRKSLSQVTGLNPEEIDLEKPENEEFGDYSTNIALRIFKKVKTKAFLLGEWGLRAKNVFQNLDTAKELAEAIVAYIKKDKKFARIFERIEVAGSGFINFYLSKESLVTILKHIVKEGEKFGKSSILKGKKILLEHTSPNTIKTLHVGHVRNNVLSMAVHNLLEFIGADVILDAINNDRGIHVMKAVWAYMKYGQDKTPDDEDVKPDHFVDRFYVMGVKAYDEDERAKEEIRELLRRWEAKDEDVRRVWMKLRDWTFEGFKQTYKRLASHHDHQWFESDFYEHGKEMVEEGLRKGVFRKLEDGAVLSNLRGYGLPDTIILRADGTSMYHTQDLYLTKLKREKFPSDLYIWDIGPEQELYLKQLFAMCEQLGIGRREDYMHLSYGFVYLKGEGKMSSRKGTVVSADWLIEETVKKAKEVILKSRTSRGLDKEKIDRVAEMVGIGAIKYSFLKMARTTDLQFDLDESLSLEGNSGPYLQYTYARTQSVLTKSQNSNLKTQSFDYLDLNLLNEEEMSLLRTFIHFPEIISVAAKSYSPNLLCNYLYDLASKFNLFYQKHRILAQNSNLKTQSYFRLALTFATGQILKTGLSLLGIETPEKM